MCPAAPYRLPDAADLWESDLRPPRDPGHDEAPAVTDRGLEEPEGSRRDQTARTFAAWRPFGPRLTSNSTRWPSCSERNPSATIAVWWTEAVVASVVLREESEALRVVEPLHGATGHADTLLSVLGAATLPTGPQASPGEDPRKLARSNPKVETGRGVCRSGRGGLPAAAISTLGPSRTEGQRSRLGTARAAQSRSPPASWKAVSRAETARAGRLGHPARGGLRPGGAGRCGRARTRRWGAPCARRPRCRICAAPR